MTIHHCPKCELRFDFKTELDDHCWHDHPQFRHEYPARVVPHPGPRTPHVRVAVPVEHHGAANLIEWLVPKHRTAKAPSRAKAVSDTAASLPEH